MSSVIAGNKRPRYELQEDKDDVDDKDELALKRESVTRALLASAEVARSPSAGQSSFASRGSQGESEDDESWEKPAKLGRKGNNFATPAATGPGDAKEVEREGNGGGAGGKEKKGRLGGSMSPESVSNNDDTDDAKVAAKVSGTESMGDEIDGIDKAHFTFPERLMELLEEGIAKDAMWWLPGGDAFTLVPKTFSERVLSRYFQGTKFESFTRKLNRWGFKRVAGQRVPANTVAYYHSMFQKGKPELVKNMRSGKKKETVFNDILLQSQLQRDFHAAAAAAFSSAAAFSPNALLASAGYPISDAVFSSQLLPSTNDLLRQHFLQQHIRSPLSQEQLAIQSLLAQQQPSQTGDLAALQRQIQLLAAEQQARVTQQLQQQQQQLTQSAVANELQQRLLAGSGFSQGQPSLPNILLGSNPQLSASLPSTSLSAASALQQPLQQQNQQQADPRLLQLLLLEQQRQEEQRKLFKRGGF